MPKLPRQLCPGHNQRLPTCALCSKHTLFIQITLMCIHNCFAIAELCTISTCTITVYALVDVFLGQTITLPHHVSMISITAIMHSVTSQGIMHLQGIPPGTTVVPSQSNANPTHTSTASSSAASTCIPQQIATSLTATED